MKTQKLSKHYLEEAFKYIEMVTNPYEKAKLCLYASEVLATIGNVKPLVFENGEESIKTENSKVFEPVDGDFDSIKEDKVEPVIEAPVQPQFDPEPPEVIMGIDPETQEEIDITQVYNLIAANIDDDNKKLLAEKITSYGCIETYKQLTNVTDGESRITLADIIVQFGYEIINKVLYDFNDGVLEIDIYEFMNNNNVDAFNSYVYTNWDAIDEKYPQ